MGGSIGELTALVRLARDLPARLRLQYVEFVRSGWDPHPRVDRHLQQLGGRPLLELEARPTGLVARDRMTRLRPDLVVLSSFRAFFQFPRFPGLTTTYLGLWREAGIPVAALDPCGDSYVSAIPPGVTVLVPRPFTYREPLRLGQVVYAAAERGGQAAAGNGRWLWAAAPWMADFQSYRAAERIAFYGLAQAGVEVSVLSPLDRSLPYLEGVQVVADGLSYEELGAVVGAHEVLVTANRRSVLAARAAALGVPIAWVDAPRLGGGGFDGETRALVDGGASEDLGPGPLPVEFRVLRCGGAAEAADSFAGLRRELAEVRGEQRQRCVEYERVAGVGEWAARVVEGVD
jgi:hypothetical protein